MFERFTERARQVVVFAQEEARALKHNYIGTEHLLLGLVREEEGVAARVLEALGVTGDQVRGKVAEIIGEGDDVSTGQIPFTPRAKKVLELSLREALNLSQNYIGTEHVLLGLMRENEGVAARILLDLNVDAEAVRRQVGITLGFPGPYFGERPPHGRFRARRPRPRAWQYHVLEAEPDIVDARFNELGSDGWELVLRLDNGRFVFKRPCP
jgi:ATP-dependent Clp protease ATP-binding subunit ClpC